MRHRAAAKPLVDTLDQKRLPPLLLEQEPATTGLIVLLQ